LRPARGRRRCALRRSRSPARRARPGAPRRVTRGRRAPPGIGRIPRPRKTDAPGRRRPPTGRDPGQISEMSGVFRSLAGWSPVHPWRRDAASYQLRNSTGPSPSEARWKCKWIWNCDVFRVTSDHSHGLPRAKAWGAARDRRVPHGTRGDAGAKSSGREVGHMDLTTVLIVVVVLLVLGGGGWGYSRWRQ